VDLESEVRTYLVHRLRDSDRVERAAILQLFGADITELIPSTLSAWKSEGLVELSVDALELRPQPRQERTRMLLWLVPEAHLEYELARRAGMELSQSGVRNLTEGLRPSSELADGFRFDGVLKTGRIQLAGGDGSTILLRVAPPLEDGAAPRLVVEQIPGLDESSRAGLSRAIGRLRALVRRNHDRAQSMR
jgi:hypothetical protein